MSTVKSERLIVGLLIVSLLFVGLGSSGANGQMLHPQRLVHLYDFEEHINGKKLGQYEKLPLHWYVMGRDEGVGDQNFMRVPLHRELVDWPGYPSWTEVRYDAARKNSGDFSFHLGLNGGSAGAFLRVGALPAVPSSDYLITTAICTTPMEHGRARLTAYFADRGGQRINASVARTDPVQTNGRWEWASVRLFGDYPEAAWIIIQIELNQPSSLLNSPLGDRQVIYEQVRGGAWFDDIGLWQLPRLTVRTQNPINVIRAPEEPDLEIEVRDLSGRRLATDVALYDHWGQQVAKLSDQLGGGLPQKRHWKPNLERYGWYLVDLIVREGSDPVSGPQDLDLVARTFGAFLWLPEEPLITDSERERFILSAERLPANQLGLLPMLMEQLSLWSAVVSAWSDTTTPMDVVARQVELDDTFGVLWAQKRRIALSLSPVPTDLAHELNIDNDDPLGMLDHPREHWMPYLRPVLMHHSQRVQNWVLGSLSRPHAFFKPDLGPLSTRVSREFRAMVASPQLVLPWTLDQERRLEVDDSFDYVIDVPTTLQANQIGPYLEKWTSGRPASFALHMPSESATELSQDRRCQDLALRMCYGWEAGTWGFVLSQAWTRSSDRDLALLPDPLLGVFSTVAHRLAGRKVRGQLPLGHGLVGMILASDDATEDGVLVAWNRSAAAAESTIEMFLGDAPVAIDVFGNRRPLPLVESRHQFELTQTPMFIEGIDSQLALFRASFRVEPSFIESKQTVHQHTIRMRNPWSRTISGHLRITGLPDWMIEPRRLHFSIASGQSTSIALRIMFPVSEVAGSKRFTATATFMADQQYSVEIITPIKLGLRDVDFDATLVLERDSQTSKVDVVVTQLITNKGVEPISLYAFAYMPNFPRQERIVPKLNPGQVIVRRFRFSAGPDQLIGKKVRVGLRETAGPAVLNKILVVDDR